MASALHIDDAGRKYLLSLRFYNLTKDTIEAEARYLKVFADYLKSENKTDLKSLTTEDVLAYQKNIINGPWNVSTKKIALYRLKKFFCYLKQRGLLLINPNPEFETFLRGNPRRLVQILTQKEMQCILAGPFKKQKWGARDKAVLELFYSSGLRRSEMQNLEISDVDLVSGLIHVRAGKGDKDRTVPIGKHAVKAIQKYLAQLRQKMEKPWKPSTVLFLSERGNKISDSALVCILRRAIACVGIKKRIYPHLIRHTMATHLLANGASLMVVQKILGHIQLNTSVIYTHLDITALKEASQLFHPRGKWQWRSKNS